MASKLWFLNSLTDRKKLPKHSNTTDDELAFVKAAAWAWYQHGSGSGSGSASKGKSTTEFDATITRRELRPSRYKLEAMRMSEQVSQIHTDKLSLLDAYEMQSISRQLNGLVQCSSNHVVDGGRMRKKKIRKGRVWLRHGAVCGREEDVVDAMVFTDRCSSSATKPSTCR